MGKNRSKEISIPRCKTGGFLRDGNYIGCDAMSGSGICMDTGRACLMEMGGAFNVVRTNEFGEMRDDRIGL